MMVGQSYMIDRGSIFVAARKEPYDLVKSNVGSRPYIF